MNHIRVEAEEPSPEAIAQALTGLIAEFRHAGPLPRGRLRRILLERGLIAEAGRRGLRRAFALTDAGRQWLADFARAGRPPIVASMRVGLVEWILLDELCAAAHPASEYMLDVGKGLIVLRVAEIHYHLLAVRIVQALKTEVRIVQALAVEDDS